MYERCRLLSAILAIILFLNRVRFYTSSLKGYWTLWTSVINLLLEQSQKMGKLMMMYLALLTLIADWLCSSLGNSCPLNTGWGWWSDT